jgi:hypothetical protein
MKTYYFWESHDLVMEGTTTTRYLKVVFSKNEHYQKRRKYRNLNFGFTYAKKLEFNDEKELELWLKLNGWGHII